MLACGSKPVTIRMNSTAKVDNRARRVVLGGGGGGAIFDRGGRLRIIDSTFTDNRCEHYGRS